MRWVWTDDMARNVSSRDASTKRRIRRLIDAPIALRVADDVSDGDIAHLLDIGDAPGLSTKREESFAGREECRCTCCGAAGSTAPA